jgi:hypothetical protein
MYPNEDFCLGCRKSKDYTDLEEHNWFYERSIHEALWSNCSKEELKEVLSKNIDVPPIDVDEYIDKVLNK